MTETKLFLAHYESVCRKEMLENQFRFFMGPLICIHVHNVIPLWAIVNSKLMQRSLPTALHGFTVNDGNLNAKISLIVPYLTFGPGTVGSMQASFRFQSPFTALQGSF